MENNNSHYEKLVTEYKEKYWPEEEDELGEEETDVDSNSVFTDSFRDSFRSDEKENMILLDNLIAEVNKFAKTEEDKGYEYSDEMTMAKEIEERHKKRVLWEEECNRRPVVEDEDDEKEEEVPHKKTEEVTEEGLLSEDVPEEVEAETTSADIAFLEEFERGESLQTTAVNKELLAKRAYVYQALDSMIPEYEEELSYYLREGETMLLAEDLPVILQSFGANPTEAESKKIVETFSKTGGGRVAFIDFLVLLSDHMANAYTAEDVIEAFMMIDLNGNGEIPVAVVKEVLTNIGERLTEAEVDELINEGDPLKEGFVKYEDLVHRMERNMYVAIPAKRKNLIKILRKEDRRKWAKGAEEPESVVTEGTVEPEEEVDPIFGALG